MRIGKRERQALKLAEAAKRAAAARALAVNPEGRPRTAWDNMEPHGKPSRSWGVPSGRQTQAKIYV